jgi:SAM-dependent methyltransferase
MSDGRAGWVAGRETELVYWRRYFTHGGLHEPELYRDRLDPDLEVHEAIARHLPDPRDRTPRILDCAAGPASTVGKVHRGSRVSLTAIDALADRYAAMLAEVGVTPPVPTVQGEVEELDRLELPGPFDVVYMRLALDHCHDPALAMRQMLAATRLDGAVVIEHYREADRHDRFEGMRWWALDPEPGDLVIRSGAGPDVHRVSQLLPQTTIETCFDEAWLTTTITRPGRRSPVH